MKKATRPVPWSSLRASDWLAIFVATGSGSGFAPIASGTFGTAVAVPLAWALGRCGPWATAAGITAAFFVAWAAAARAGRVFGHHDDGRIVIDEVAGYLIAVAFVPPTLPNLIAGFLLFRLFDIVKPWPASYFDRSVRTGLGTTMDDVCAGVYARAAMALWLLIVRGP